MYVRINDTDEAFSVRRHSKESLQDLWIMYIYNTYIGIE